MKSRDGMPPTFIRRFDRVVTAAIDAEMMPPDNTTLCEAGLDSFGVVYLLMELESSFGAMWPLEDLVTTPGTTTLGELRSSTLAALWREDA